jgi:membrane-associated protein
MSPTIAWLVGLSGYTLIAVICGLIALEELGIPMPFMPGDVLLFLAGASMATAEVNPFVVVTAVYVSALVGAIGGREVFMRIGGAALPRVVAFLRVRERFDDLAARLRSGGSAAVFLGRLTPGLRVVTTQLSGLVGMPRRTFLVGLVPGVAVYQAVFITLGALLGKPAWVTMEHYSQNPLVLLLVVLTVLTFGLSGHVLVRYNRGRRRRMPRRAPAPTMAPSPSATT